MAKELTLDDVAVIGTKTSAVEKDSGGVNNGEVLEAIMSIVVARKLIADSNTVTTKKALPINFDMCKSFATNFINHTRMDGKKMVDVFTGTNFNTDRLDNIYLEIYMPPNKQQKLKDRILEFSDEKILNMYMKMIDWVNIHLAKMAYRIYANGQTNIVNIISDGTSDNKVKTDVSIIDNTPASSGIKQEKTLKFSVKGESNTLQNCTVNAEASLTPTKSTVFRKLTKEIFVPSGINFSMTETEFARIQYDSSKGVAVAIDSAMRTANKVLDKNKLINFILAAVFGTTKTKDVLLMTLSGTANAKHYTFAQISEHLKNVSSLEMIVSLNDIEKNADVGVFLPVITKTNTPAKLKLCGLRLKPGNDKLAIYIERGAALTSFEKFTPQSPTK